MPANEFCPAVEVDRTPLERLGFNPYYRPFSGLERGLPRSEGVTFYDLASNDYLGLASDPRVREAMIAAIREYGASMCGTPVTTGYACVLRDLEQKLARFTGLEAVAVFPSGFQANQAVFPALASAQDVILVDQQAHASLVQGIRAVGCRLRPFRHHDLEHLAEQLARVGSARPTLVVTESVFSTEGSVAPLAAIVELCRRHGAIPVVDDSHGLGVIGPTGRGILEAAGLPDYPGIYTASLGKALANAGGMVGGPRRIIEALRYSCAGLIYSTALPPVCAAGTLCVLELIEREFATLGAALWASHRRLVEVLERAGLPAGPAQAPIAAIRCPSPESAIILARAFHRQQVVTVPFVPPSVPPGQGLVRLILGAKLRDPAFHEALAAVAGAAQVFRAESVARP